MVESYLTALGMNLFISLPTVLKLQSLYYIVI